MSCGWETLVCGILLVVSRAVFFMMPVVLSISCITIKDNNLFKVLWLLVAEMCFLTLLLPRCRNYATLLLASSWRYIVDMWTEYTASSLHFRLPTGSTLWVDQKTIVCTYGICKGEIFFRNWKAILTPSSQYPAIQQRTRLLRVALIMIGLWDYGFKMADELAKLRLKPKLYLTS
jgi:hypothetical protein